MLYQQLIQLIDNEDFSTLKCIHALSLIHASTAPLVSTANVEAEQRTARDCCLRLLASLANGRSTFQEVVVLVSEERCNSGAAEVWKLDGYLLGSIAVVDDLHGGRAVSVGEGGDVEVGRAAGGSNAGGTLSDELLAEVSVRPQSLGRAHDLRRRGVDVDQALVCVVLLRSAPPVQEPGDVAGTKS